MTCARTALSTTSPNVARIGPSSCDSLNCRLNYATPFVSQHQNEWHAELFDSIFDASQNGVREDVPRESDYKEIAKSLIKDNFRWDARIRTSENDRDWALALGNRSATCCGLTRIEWFPSYIPLMPLQQLVKVCASWAAQSCISCQAQEQGGLPILPFCHKGIREAESKASGR